MRARHGSLRGILALWLILGAGLEAAGNPELPEPPAPQEPPPGTITDWEISRAFPASRVNRQAYPRFYSIFYAGWQKVDGEPSGLVDVARYRERGGGAPGCVLARTIARADARERIELSFGTSGEVSLFLNGKLVVSGQGGHRSGDSSLPGPVGLSDSVHLDLEKGLNEIFLMVTESPGGWGFMARADRPLKPPIRDHANLTRLWETEPVFLTPESVLYDGERDLLYVTSFDSSFAQKSEPSGFISKLRTDGEVEELRWVKGLHAPAGMAIAGDRLYVAERGRLAEIDLVSGAVERRFEVPGSTFLNDVAGDSEGNLYVTDSFVTSPENAAVIYRLAGGKVEVWLEDSTISRANGLFVDGGELLVGSTGDGTLKAVGLNGKRVRTIAALGAGVVDGIRVDAAGNYLVSHWEGQVYRVSPSGGVTEILDTLPAAMNSADFELIRDKGILVVPTFTDNRVVAYAVGRPPARR